MAVLDSVADMAGSYAIPGISIDGQDIVEVYEVVGQAVERARKGGGPTLVEAKTYRFHGHSLGDEEQYRSSDEVETWKNDRDPITLFRTVMMHKNWLTEERTRQFRKRPKTRF